MGGDALNHKVRIAVIVKVGCHSPGHARGKNAVGAVARSCSIAGYDSEMIRHAGSQAAEGCSNVLCRAALEILTCGAGTVVSRGSVLEMNSGIQSVGIDRAIERC